MPVQGPYNAASANSKRMNCTVNKWKFYVFSNTIGVVFMLKAGISFKSTFLGIFCLKWLTIYWFIFICLLLHTFKLWNLWCELYKFITDLYIYCIVQKCVCCKCIFVARKHWLCDSWWWFSVFHDYRSCCNVLWLLTIDKYGIKYSNIIIAIVVCFVWYERIICIQSRWANGLD